MWDLESEYSCKAYGKHDVHLDYSSVQRYRLDVFRLKSKKKNKVVGFILDILGVFQVRIP